MKLCRSLLPMLAMLAIPSTLYAGAESGFYLGGSVGTAEVDYSDNDPDIGEINFDDDDTGYKVFGGYNFGVIPLIDLGIELSYVDLGSHEGEIAGITGNDLEVDAWTLTGLVGFKLGPFGLFAKAGAATWDGDVKSGSESASDDGTDPVYGIGARFQIGSFALRAEYELFDLQDIEIDYYSVGAAYTF